MAPATAPKPIANIVNEKGSGTANRMPGPPPCGPDPPSWLIPGETKPGPFDSGAPACEFGALVASNAFELDRPVGKNGSTKSGKPVNGTSGPGAFRGPVSLD
jgi:hypothetical protein